MGRRPGRAASLVVSGFGAAHRPVELAQWDTRLPDLGIASIRQAEREARDSPWFAGCRAGERAAAGCTRAGVAVTGWGEKCLRIRDLIRKSVCLPSTRDVQLGYTCF